ncbi:hypothetical protein BOTBODRAFT_139303 [Botryobasidium botryosum FD-172 SS1]|uniref:Uncharacterized protein n=1 Tax=Botryobasidium botryosum (strain FD-172 SS1) TaxID=930990 RepID=A0A067M0B8_BOTB1|nr:hypothetical protein BOTBODRAFT_139303 [Botryobasidium botryosum FD-172 SS1]
MDDSRQVIAKIPFPNAGPARLLTCSEVATMDFLCTRLGAPVPSASKDNPIGCEYIIMELCEGTAFAEQEYISTTVLKEIAISQMHLSDIPFSQYGSIFYTQDVSPELQSRPLYSGDFAEEEFRIGPSVERRFYRSERAHVELDRGPWKDIYSYIRAIAACEIDWIRAHSGSPAAQEQLGAHHTPEEHTSMLEQWLSLAPAVLPQDPQLLSPTLMHPDLHGINIMVKPAISPADSDTISIIDWQGTTSVRPLFESVLPTCLTVDPADLRFVKLSKNLDPPTAPDVSGLDTDQQAVVECELGRITMMKHHLRKIAEIRPALYLAMQSEHALWLRHALYFSSHTWSDGLPNLTQTLVKMCAEYGGTIPVHEDYPHCPISFSPEDDEARERDLQRVVGLEAQLEYLVQKKMKESGIILHTGGLVSAEDFDLAKKIDGEYFAEMMNAGDMDAKAVERLRSIWPTRPGRFDFAVESCV